MKSRLLNLAAILFLFCAPSPQSAASILNSGKSWLNAPEAVFAKELKNGGLVSSREAADEPYRDPQEATMQADLKDLGAALSAAGKADNAEILRQYKEVREAIYARENNSAEVEGTRDPFVALESLGALDLPSEFLLYLKGAAHWRLNDKSAAVSCWNRLLELPIAERHYHSTWAAYMLARHLINTNPARAHEMLDTLRRLAEAGFADSLNLAKDSMGWEAAAFLKEGNYAKALELYIQQNDINSLRIAAAKAIDHASSPKLQDLAANEQSLKVITSYLISGGLTKSVDSDEESAPLTDRRQERLAKWIAAVEAAEVKSQWVSERLALAAYQLKDFEAAQEWVDASPGSLTSQWLQAKLHFRKGHLEEAASVLRALAGHLPSNDDSPDLVSALEIRNEFDSWQPARRRVLAELGIVELHLENFVPALNAFEKADYWTDTAFVAERILTVDELKKYVDAADSNSKLRPLFARRLMRLNRIREARPYFPANLQEFHDRFTETLQAGFDKSETAENRGQNFFGAATLARHHGLELFATELEPDWAIHDGRSEFGLTSETRLNTEPDALPPSESEKERIKSSELPFSQRFHYRYVAAELAWIASLYLPNNDEQTARILCESGSWVKNIDSTYADRFYKSLVRRCRATELGNLADKKRWFPILDGNGNIQKEVPLVYRESDAAISEAPEIPSLPLLE
jgi:hypothetical protein